MNEIICFLFGHKLKIIERKVKRMAYFGEITQQYITEVDLFCERCGKYQSKISGKFTCC
jgi:hypothetical protein